MSRKRSAQRGHKAGKSPAPALRTGSQRRPRLVKTLTDPQVSVDEGVAFLLAFHEGRACRLALAAMVAYQASPERMAELAAKALASAPDSLTALSFGAQAACYQGDHARALALVDAALASGQGEDRILRETRAAVLLEAGRIADALDEVDSLCRQHPESREAQSLRRDALAEVARRAVSPPGGTCPCGAGGPYAACCGPRESAALRRFGYRRAWDDLRVAVLDHAQGREGLVDAILDTWNQAQEEWLGEIALDPGDPELALALDWGLTWLSVDDGTGPPDDDRGDDIPALASFVAAQEAGDTGLAHQWLEHHRVGAWQVGQQQGGPGLWLADLLTGLQIYADVPGASAVDDPWAILLGLMVCDDGIWRAGGGLVVLSPVEGDSLVARAIELAELAVKQFPDYRDRARDLRRIPRDIPPGLLAERGELDDPRITELLYLGAASHLPELAAAVRIHRAVQLNSDDEPIELIDATIALTSLPKVRAALRARSDIQPDGHGGLVWVGRSLEADPLRPTLGSPPLGRRQPALVEEGDLVALATLRFERGVVATSVNSRSRLERLLDILRGIDPAAAVIEKRSEVPGHTAVWERGAGGATDEAVADWEDAWPDTPQRGLDGLTPRRAAALPRVAPRLELALRELEFHAALARRVGYPTPDLAAMRAALAMPASRLIPFVAEGVETQRPPGSGDD